MNDTGNSKLLVFLATAFLLFGCSEPDVLTGTGAGTGTGTTTTTGSLSIGKGLGTTFTAGTIEIKNAAVTVNGSTDVSVYIVDSNNNLSQASNTVTFKSACSINGLASFTSASITTTTGIATTTYLDQGCSTSDTVIATAGWDANLTAFGDLTIDSTAPATANTLRIGTGTLLTFVEGAVNVTLSNIASDGSTAVSVNLVDFNGDLLTSANSVTFSSNCEQLGQANFTKPVVTTSTGTATTTYNAAGCVGSDTISASITIGATTKIATGTVIVAAASAGSIQFTSALPTLIALKGTGTTTGLPENSTITFTVLDGSSQPVANESVTFSLNSTIGGITLSLYTVTSDDSGIVSTTLQSGSVATSVRVSAVVDSNTALATTSDAIAIATGPPDQNSMSLSAEILNPRAWNINGKTVAITAQLADRFNNPIQDGTAVLFTTELGSIQPTCTTTNGSCTVNWTSQDPRGTTANAGRTTILATVEGEESFIDLNANGIFDGTDTFTDLGEAYIDENESGSWESPEPFTDFNGNNVWDGPDGKYSGSGCATNCAPTNSVTVRDDIVLVMSEDNPAIFAMGTNGSSNNLCFDFASCLTYRFSGAALNTDVVGSLSITLAGVSNGEVLPAGTTVGFATTNGKINSGATHSIGHTTSLYNFYVSISADTTPSNDGGITMDVTIGDSGGSFSWYFSVDDSGNAPIPTTIQLGTGDAGTFVNGALNITTPSLSAGGTTPVSVNIVDATNGNTLLTTSNTVTFTSSCVQSGLASFDTASVVTTTGTATANYTSITCEGIDTITVTSDAAIATGDVTIAAAAAGSIQLSSVSNSLIALKGTGSNTGIPESSNITFTVLNAQGGAVSGGAVNFSLDSTVGGISLVSASANTNANGEVIATVQSGTVATSVRVTATVASNTALATTSSAIVIATGPPDQDSISLSATELNPRAWDFDGTDVTITARLADRFNNKIQDGTAIVFSTELGSIDSSCTTVNGACSVSWTSQAPRGTAGATGNAGRSTILASVEGEESFVDRDGDGVFSDGDTFTDLPEAFQDDNENGSHDPNEPYIDFNSDATYTDVNTKYNGAGCTHSTLCHPKQAFTVRDSLVLVMAEDSPGIIAIKTNVANLCTSQADCGLNYPASIDLTAVKSVTFTIVGNANNQILPVGTTITFGAGNGTITAGGTHTVGNTNIDVSISPGIAQYTVYLKPDTTPSDDGVLNIDIIIPGGGTYGLPPIDISDI